MLIALHIALALAALWLIGGTLLNFSKLSHWYVRGWDFPRVFTAGLATLVGVPYAVWFTRGAWYDWALLAGLLLVIARQLYLIYPYTPLARKSVKRSMRAAGEQSFRLLISNVQMENRRHDLWLDVVRKADPDVIVVVETDQAWIDALRPLEADYPNTVHQPQDNWYGMAVYSRLELSDVRVRHLVQEDIPSVHATLHLRNGQTAALHALHPRPPEPLRDQDSTPRDAELVVVAKEIEKAGDHVPTVVCGDLNDVAWSFTTQLFLRLSKLLDPRKGRGMFNSYNANSRLFRFPLDHVFHSNEFKLIDLRVCDHVGSDHFPVLIELSLEPQAPAEQPEPRKSADDEEHAEELVEAQQEKQATGEEGGHVAREDVSKPR